jgi:hypothetical protein
MDTTDIMNVFINYVNKEEHLIKASKEGRKDIVEFLINIGAVRATP